MSVDLQSISASIALFRSLLGSVKDVKDILPKGAQKEQFESALANAERQTALVESQLALLLGYKLCKCEFPPHPMLRSGTIDGRENFRCPKCGSDSVPRFSPTRAETDYDIFNL
jgi:hypothetical protein